MSLGFFLCVFVALAKDLLSWEVVAPDPLHHLFFVFHALLEVADALSEAASDGALPWEYEIALFMFFFILFEFDLFVTWRVVHLIFHEQLPYILAFIEELVVVVYKQHGEVYFFILKCR